jgi:small subunit ribosomal protein S7
MSRRHQAKKREILPDVKYGDFVVAKFINRLMVDGKKSVAERLFYGALDIIQSHKKDPIEIFRTAMSSVKPDIEVRSRRVGGATYQVPMEVRPDRSQALAIRWIIAACQKRNELTMMQSLAAEFMDASQNRGASVKKREDTHKMAEANQAFSHYRW